MGMDIDASAWNWDVASRAALPVGLLFVLLIGAGVVLLSSVHSVDVSPKPVLRRLLPPLVVMILLLILGTGIFEWYQYRQHHATTIADKLLEIKGDLNAALESRSSGMTTALQPIVADERMRSALLAGDRDRLLADWQPVFENMHKDNHIIHFNFFDTNRVCLLRVHKPEKHGDLINRFTTLEAERTGKTALGIELCQQGAFTLRAIQPVFQDSRLIGYVELGREIEDILHDLHERSGSHLALVIRKEYLDQKKWAATWDQLPKGVIIYSSLTSLPDVFTSVAEHNPDGRLMKHNPDGTLIKQEVNNVNFDGLVWSLSAIPMQDVSGKEVGGLLTMLDITTNEAAFTRLMVLGGTFYGILLLLLVAFVYVLLHRTDRNIALQRSELQDSESRLSAFSEIIEEAIFISVKGIRIEANESAKKCLVILLMK